MNEEIFKEILSMALEEEFAEFDNAPEHKFSLRHRLAMKRIFAKYQRNVRKLQRKNGDKDTQIENRRTVSGLKKRLLVTAVIIFIASLLVGWVCIAKGLYKIDSSSPKGYTVNEAMLSQIKSDDRVPTYEITEEQAEWLGTKYDLELLSICDIESEEYGNFIMDLVKLNVFSSEDARSLFGVMPFNANHKGYLYKEDTGDGIDGYVNPFGGEDNYLDEDELSAGLIIEYLKSEYTGYSEEQYRQMAEELSARKQTCLKVLNDFFARFSNSTESLSDHSGITFQDICYEKH